MFHLHLRQRLGKKKITAKSMPASEDIDAACYQKNSEYNPYAKYFLASIMI